VRVKRAAEINVEESGNQVGKKIERALQRGGRSAHPFSWLLSSPQQPLETEDPPTVSLAPQYTSQHLCRAIAFFSPSETQQNRAFAHFPEGFEGFTVKQFHPSQGKNFSVWPLPRVLLILDQQSKPMKSQPSAPISDLIASARALAWASIWG